MGADVLKKIEQQNRASEIYRSTVGDFCGPDDGVLVQKMFTIVDIPTEIRIGEVSKFVTPKVDAIKIGERMIFSPQTLTRQTVNQFLDQGGKNNLTRAFRKDLDIRLRKVIGFKKSTSPKV